MKKFKSYIQSACYNILHNKAYALFCILGTALTFIFIAIILQFTNGILNNVPPAIHTDRVIQVGTSFSDESDQIWAPSTLNKFIPSGDNLQTLYILHKEGIALPAFKDKIVSALKFHYDNKSVNIDLDRKDILTQREVRIQSFGNDKLAYGIPILGIYIEQTLVFIILMINMVSLAITVNKYNEPGLLNTDQVINFGYMATDFGSPDLKMFPIVQM